MGDLDTPESDTPVWDMLAVDMLEWDTPALDTPGSDTMASVRPRLRLIPTTDTDTPALDTPAVDTPDSDTPAVDTLVLDTLDSDTPGWILWYRTPGLQQYRIQERSGIPGIEGDTPEVLRVRTGCEDVTAGLGIPRDGESLIRINR